MFTLSPLHTLVLSHVRPTLRLFGDLNVPKWKNKGESQILDVRGGKEQKNKRKENRKENKSIVKNKGSKYENLSSLINMAMPQKQE